MKYLNDQELNKINKDNNYTYKSYDSCSKPGNLYFNLQNKNNLLRSKIVSSLEEVINKSGLKDGMTISFHHAFRHGDQTFLRVMQVIDKLNIKNLTVLASSFTKSHDCFIDYIQRGVVTALEGSAIRGELGNAISEGVLLKPVIIRSHGGRARYISTGEPRIDVAFLAASSSDEMGNANGVKGDSCVGSLGYAMVDAQYANKTVIITDSLVDYPNSPISIPQIYVDFVVQIDNIGDNSKISSGEIHSVFKPKEIQIAENIVQVIINTPYFRDGFSFQTGTGGASQASLMILTDVMMKQKIKASFFLGGIIQPQVELLKQNLVDKLLDVQSFDLTAIRSLRENNNHLEMSASFYANPFIKGCAVNKLDYGILSALEIDVNFNCNVITGADGYLRGASGGHSDVAYGSKISIVAVPLVRGRISSVVDRVQTVVTPGNTVDILVTDVGIAVNPLRSDLIEIFKNNQVPTKDIRELRDLAYSIVGVPEKIIYNTNHIIALIEYRDGTLIDVVYKSEKFSL
ncbi:citrate lyase subunit alpha [Candidatus Phytoplasma melaleucae]|uniref:Citrate lyase alpha chain n=1 Tax=Candidatus Phytoplasma melaleucae TaxID=2982630 RepID=A0ABT9DFE5_9MOLU|nr:citrate lyase subunit alpha ['Melaleuca sp.' phytoplasma]MDO8167920.1 citrate lyase subunit alpha ['Melaleuca sp.' phytoplasma]